MTATLEFRLLGNFEVLRDGQPVAVSSNKARAVLATLLIAENRPVPVDTLIERLWGAHPPETATATLQVHVMRLRRALGEEQVIQTTAGGYRCDVAVAQADVLRFRDALRRAYAANVSGAVDTEVALLTEALALWRGPALLGVGSESLQQVVAPQLTDERLRAVERRAEIALAAGRHEEVAGELTALVAEHPLREQLWERLIEALHGSGRRVEALATYRRMQREFRDLLGIDPGRRVQQLQLEILADDELPAPPAARITVRPGQLPPDPQHYVGRAAAQAEVLERLGTPAPLIVVTGAPGVGKSALVVHVAHGCREAFPDGQLHVDLRGHSAEDPLAASIALERFLRALGVPAADVPADPDERSNLYRSLLADRRVLVLLDNAASPGQVRPLLPGSAGCAAVVTSRNDLRGLTVTDGGRQITLGPLTEDESLGVLAEMLGPARLAAEPAAARELAQSCGRLPLALRIAGANLQARPEQSIAAATGEMRVPGRLGALQVPGDDAVAVRAAFDLSYLRLPTAVARLFRLLGVVPGPDFTAATAAVLVDTGDGGALLDALVRAHLVDTGNAGRYRLHDLIREYAAERAAEFRHETRDALVRLFDHYLHSARNATRLRYPQSTRLSLTPPVEGAQPVEPPTADAALAWLDAELPNLVAAALRAHDYRAPLYARQLAETLRGYVEAEGHGLDGLDICRAALTAARREQDRAAEGAVLDLTGLIHYVLGRYGEAIEHHVAGLDILREVGEPGAVLGCLHNLARACSQLGRHDAAITHHEEALGIATAIGDKAAQVVNLNHLGFIHIVAGRPGSAGDWHRRALAISREIGDRPALARAYNGVGLAAWATGDLHASIAAHQQARQLAQEIGDDHLRGFSTVWLAGSRCAVGDAEQAIADAEQAVALGRVVGEKRLEITGTYVQTDARYHRGDRIGALAAYTDALAEAREIDFRYGEMPLLLRIALVLREAGDAAAAMGRAEQALQVAQGIGMQMWEATALTEIARCRIELAGPQDAGPLLDRALRLAEKGGYRLTEAGALHVLGLADAALGRTDRAVAHWRDAHEIAVASGAREATQLAALIEAGAR